MKHYGLDIAEGSEVVNLTIPSGTAFPSNDNVGELFFRTDTNTFNVRKNSTWDSVSFDVGTGIANVVEDLTPQLGGNLNINGFDITTSTGTNGAKLNLFDSSTTLIGAVGTGVTGGAISIIGGSSDVTAGAVQIIGGVGSRGGNVSLGAGAGSTDNGGDLFLTGGISDDGIGGDIFLRSGGSTNSTSGNISLQPGMGTGNIPGELNVGPSNNGAGAAVALRFKETSSNGSNYIGLIAPSSITNSRTWILPTDDPAVAIGRFLTTDATGNLSFAIPSGGLSDVVGDLTPQLGGDLDVNGFNIVGTQPATSTSAGGTLILQASDGGSSSGASGSISLLGGTPVDGFGGNIILTAASGIGTNRGGGSVNFTAGDATGTASAGSVSITAGNDGPTGGSVYIQTGRSGTNFSAPIYVRNDTNAVDSPLVAFTEAGTNGFNYVGLRSPTAITTNREWVLPVDDPATVNGNFLTTDATGNLSFAVPTSTKLSKSYFFSSF
jgi:hypothetical protein